MRPLWLKDPKTGKIIHIPYDILGRFTTGSGPINYFVDTASSNHEAIEFLHTYPRFFKKFGDTWYTLRKRRQSWLGYQLSLMTDHGKLRWLVIGIVINIGCAVFNLAMALRH